MGAGSRGFTIVETMLFLAISGVLIIAMVAGTGVSINVQRYRDAVETFKALLQDQYDALASVQNERDDNWSCGAQAESEIGGDSVRGQSDCVLVGRYLAIENDTVSLYSVLARGVTTPSASGTDIDKLRANYIFNVSTVDQEEEVMEWGTRIAWPSSGGGSRNPATPRSLGILFVRSPDSGQIYTFSADTIADPPSPSMLSSMIVAGAAVPGQSERTICVDSNGAFITANQSIYLAAYANGPSSIESQSNDFIANPTSPRTDHTTRC
jgi:type II secretory pathway pseudopilin PulG